LFINSIHSDAILKRYCYGLDKFCEYARLSCDELVKLDTEDLQTRLEDWVTSMRQVGLRRSSIRTPLAAVEKFLGVKRKLYYKRGLLGFSYSRSQNRTRRVPKKQKAKWRINNRRISTFC